MKKIAVIEDNSEMRENIEEILELADYEVVTAPDGKKGVELVKAELPDIIICDVMMPELDGYGLLYYLSKSPATNKIPFIFLTAKTERADMRKGMSMGADDYITKPFEEMELLEAIEARLKRSELFVQESQQDNKLEDFFAKAEKFEGLDKLANQGRTKNYSKKDQIYYEGDSPSFVYYVVKGKVRNYRVNEDGKEFVTDLYSAGDFFGFVELMQQKDYEEYSSVLEDTQLSLINGDEFQKLVLGNREAAAAFINLLAGNVLEKEQDLINLAYDTVRKRVADSLVKLHDKYASEGTFSMSISRDELASMVGTATESVIRVLGEFKADGNIAVKGSNITILNIQALQNYRY